MLVRQKAYVAQHKIADKWEQTPYCVMSQLDDQPVFKIQEVGMSPEARSGVLPRNMLYPICSLWDERESGNQVSQKVHVSALSKANQLMNVHFGVKDSFESQPDVNLHKAMDKQPEAFVLGGVRHWVSPVVRMDSPVVLSDQV